MSLKIGFIDTDKSPSGSNRYEHLKSRYAQASSGRDNQGANYIDFVAHWKTVREFTEVMMTAGSMALNTINRVVILQTGFMNPMDANACLDELVKMQQALIKSGVQSTKVVLMASSVDIFDKIKQFPNKYMLYKHFMVTNAQRNSEGKIDVMVLDGIITGSSDNELFTITTSFRDEGDMLKENSERLKKNLTEKSDLHQRLAAIKKAMAEKTKEKDALAEKEKRKEKAKQVQKSVAKHVKKSSESVQEVISDEILVEKERLNRIESTLTYKSKLLKDRGFVVSFGSPTWEWNKRFLNCARLYAGLGRKVLFINLTSSYSWNKEIGLNDFTYDKLPNNMASIDRYEFPNIDQVNIYSNPKDRTNQYELLNKFYNVDVLNTYHIIFINMLDADFSTFIESYHNPFLTTNIVIYGDDDEITANIVGNRTSPLIKFSGIKTAILRVFNRTISNDHLDSTMKLTDQVRFQNNLSIVKNLFLGGINYNV